MQSVASRIRELREDNDYNQKELAERLGTSQQAISLYEKGLRELSYELLIGYAKLFRVTTDYILCLSDVPQKGWISEK